MPLIDDVEFYGRAVDAGEVDRQTATRLLAEASGGKLTERGANRWLDNWHGARARLESQLFDIDDTLRALKNGRQIPEHVALSVSTSVGTRVPRSFGTTLEPVADGSPWPLTACSRWLRRCISPPPARRSNGCRSQKNLVR